MTQKIIRVVAALIESNGKFLLARRLTGTKELVGKWEFPGGKVEPDETDEHAIEREINEEFEMKIKAIRFLEHNVCEYPDKTVDLRLYLCNYLSGEFKLHDHSEYTFVEKSKLTDYDLCPADIPLAEYVKNQHDLRI